MPITIKDFESRFKFEMCNQQYEFVPMAEAKVIGYIQNNSKDGKYECSVGIDNNRVKIYNSIMHAVVEGYLSLYLCNKI